MQRLLNLDSLQPNCFLTCKGEWLVGKGLPCNMKHVWFVTDQSCATFGSRLVLPFCFWGMPEITPTDLAQLGQLASDWVDRGRRLGFPTRPAGLSVAERRADPGEAAAFSLVTFTNSEFLEACDRCGLWTASWCEGCYSRAVRDRDLEFTPICTICDQEKLVCTACQADGKSWQDGHLAYTAHFAEEAAGQVLIETPTGGTGIFTVVGFSGSATPRTGTGGAGAPAEQASSSGPIPGEPGSPDLC